MTAAELLGSEKAYLAQLLEAIQRCVYFLDATIQKLPFPLQGDELENRKKDVSLFELLLSFNERFSKLQDTLGICTKSLSQVAHSRSAGSACKRKRSLYSRCKQTAQAVQFISCSFLSFCNAPYLLLLGEKNEYFLKVLALYEKHAVIESLKRGNNFARLEI